MASPLLPTLLAATTALAALVQASSDPQRLCPPCAAVARAQQPDDIPSEALSDRGWALGGNGVNLGPLRDRLTSGILLGTGATIVQIDTGITDHPLLHVYGADGGVDVQAAEGLFGTGHTNKDELLSGLLRNPGHGTKTSSVIIGRPTSQFRNVGDDTKNVYGVAPGARVIAVKATQGVVLLPEQLGDVDADFRRVAFVLNQVAQRNHPFQDVDVVSMSLGGWPPTADICPAIEDATDSGVIVVVAAGNKVRSTKYPAKCATAIAVGGSTYRQDPWSGSAGSADVVVSAPAQGVWTASVVSGAYCIEASSGTSFATALIAGLASEWVADHRRRGTLPADPPQAFRDALRQSARGWKDPSWTSRFGAGIVDATRLLGGR